MELPTGVPGMQAVSQAQSVNDKPSISGDAPLLDRLGTVSIDPAKALLPAVWSRKWGAVPRAPVYAPLPFAQRQALKQPAASLAAPCFCFWVGQSFTLWACPPQLTSGWLDPQTLTSSRGSVDRPNPTHFQRSPGGGPYHPWLRT